MDSTSIKLEPGTSAEESGCEIFTEIDIYYPVIKNECLGSISENKSDETSTAEHSNLERVTIKAEPGNKEMEISYSEIDIELPDIKKECLEQSERIHQTEDVGPDSIATIPHPAGHYRTDKRRKVPENFVNGNSSLLKKPTLDIQVGVDISKLKVNPSGKKKYFCCYCKTLQSKFARHLELKHNTEKDVQKFSNLPKGNHERLLIIDAIRKRGNFIHNTNSQFNTGVLITCRQRQTNIINNAQDYICCANCKGFFSKRTLRLHYKKCNESYKKGSRIINIMGRRSTGFLHNRANDILRYAVFPILTDDIITKSIQYDELVIVFGNNLCEKYKTHQHDMIRAHLRLLGRFKIAIKKINKEITDFASIFQPQHFDSVISALRVCAKWDKSIMWFKTPAVANNLTTLLKKLARCLLAECIKKQDGDKKKLAEDFLVLFKEVLVIINKPVIEVSDLAKLRGHSKQIHKFNRIPVTVRDVTNVSILLKAAMDEDATDEDESYNDNNFPQQSGILKNISTSHSDSTGSPGSDKICTETRTRRSNISSPYDSLPGSTPKNNNNTKHRCLPKDRSFNESDEKRRKTSPYGKKKRVKWSEAERKAASEYFGDFKALNKLPSLDECRKAIGGNSVLGKRQPQQLKTWIDNQRRAEARRQSYAVKKSYL